MQKNTWITLSNNKQQVSIPWLDENQPHFPATNNALPYPPGLLAAGGNLEPETLIQAYSHGIFPWYNNNEPILWWSPEPRCILYCDQFHASRSLKKSPRKQLFTAGFDENFKAVIEHCSDREETWISSDIKNAYQTLHDLGVAHSIEVFSRDKLVGGLYGVALGKVFFGESMFSLVPDASKFALWKLSEFLKMHDYRLIDCQQETSHLLSLGACSVSRELFEMELAEGLKADGLPRSEWSGVFKAYING